MKKAFGLPQAIMLILFIGSIVLIGIKYARVGVNHYADTYLKEQARLYMQSIKERVLYDISKNKCKSSFSYTTKIGNEEFTAKAEARYFYHDKAPIKCNGANDMQIQSPQSNGMIALKIEVFPGLVQQSL